VTQTRIYLPLDAAGVRRLAQDREIGGSRGGGLRAFAVTGQVERDHPLGDEEEWEYAALGEACDAATSLRGGAATKRVIVAADVDPTWVTAGTGSAAAVMVSSPVPLSKVVAFHVDETAGDDGMQDLLWYDATELDEVLTLV
jgi:hypothetical protein